jgi:CHAT domain-containing protein
MEPLLNGVKDVYFSPTGYLNTLAFAAIKCPDGQYLMDHYQLHQLTSTAELTKRGFTHDHHTSAMLLGAVYYSPEQEQLAKDIRDNEADRGSIDGRGVVDDEEEAFGYLPYTLEEVDDIEKIMQKAHVDCQMLTGFKSTEPSLATLSGQSPSILHLSTHGFFVATEEDVMANKFLARFPAMRFWAMQRSGLALVGANDTWNGNAEKEESDDGILTAAEVALLDLRKTRLAVLSACQTGVGLYNRDGVYGMQRGFKQAGVRSILATLWNVNDKSTAELMKAFYGKWLSGTGMQQYMQESIQELRKAYPAPFYWAPFILMDAEN